MEGSSSGQKTQGESLSQMSTLGESSTLPEYLSKDADSLIKEVFHENTLGYSGIIRAPEKIFFLLHYFSSEIPKIQEKIILIDQITKIVLRFPFLATAISFSSYNDNNFVDLLINFYLENLLTEDTKINTKILTLVSLFIEQIEVNKKSYEIVYKYLSAYFRNEHQESFTKEKAKSILTLLKVLYGDKAFYKRTLNSKEFQHNYFFFDCKGSKIECRSDDKKLTFKDGFKFLFWGYVPFSKEDYNESTKERTNILRLEMSNSNKFILSTENGLLNASFENKKCFASGIPMPTNNWFLMSCEIKKSNLLFRQSDEIEIVIKVKNERTTYKEKISECFFGNNNIYLTKILLFENYLGLISSWVLFDVSKVDQKSLNYLESLSYGIENLELYNNFAEIIKSKNNIKMIITPFHYNQRENVFMNVVNEASFGLSYQSKCCCNVRKNPQNYKLIQYVGGMNSLLPLIEVLRNCNILDEEILYEYLSLVNKCLEQSENNLSVAIKELFFQSLGLFIAEIPKKDFSMKIFEVLLAMRNTILEKIEKLKQSKFTIDEDFYSFFRYVLYNEKIIEKFPIDMQIQLWEKLYHSNKIYKNIFSDCSSLCFILRKYESQRYEKFCCKEHSSFFNNEINRNAMNPELKDRIKYLVKIIETYVVDEDESKKNSIIILRLLALDLSPCLQASIIRIFYNYLENNAIPREKKKSFLLRLLKHSLIDIMFFLMSVGLMDVRIQVINFFFLLYRKFSSVLFNYAKDEFNNNFDLFNEKFFETLKVCVIPENLKILSEKSGSCQSDSNLVQVKSKFFSSNEVPVVCSPTSAKECFTFIEAEKENSELSEESTEKEEEEESSVLSSNVKKKENNSLPCQYVEKINMYFSQKKDEPASKEKVRVLAWHCVSHIEANSSSDVVSLTSEIELSDLEVDESSNFGVEKKEVEPVQRFSASPLPKSSFAQSMSPCSTIDFSLKKSRTVSAHTDRVSKSINFNDSEKDLQVFQMNFQKIDNNQGNDNRLRSIITFLEKGTYSSHLRIIVETLERWLSLQTEIYNNKTIIRGLVSCVFKVLSNSGDSYMFLDLFESIVLKKLFAANQDFLYHSEFFYKFLIEATFQSEIETKFPNLVELPMFKLLYDLNVPKNEIVELSGSINVYCMQTFQFIFQSCLESDIAFLELVLNYGNCIKLLYLKEQINTLIDDLIRSIFNMKKDKIINYYFVEKDYSKLDQIIEFSSLMYEFVFFYKNITCFTSQTRLKEFDDIQTPFLRIEENQGDTLNRIWKDFSIFASFFRDFHIIWEYEKYLDILSSQKKEIKYENKKEKLIAIITSLATRNSKHSKVFQEDLELFLTASKIYQISIGTVLSNFFITTLSYAKEEKEIEFWVSEYEKFVEFLIIASTNQFYSENGACKFSEVFSSILISCFFFFVDRIKMQGPFNNLFLEAFQWIIFTAIETIHLNVKENLEVKERKTMRKKCNFFNSPVFDTFNTKLLDENLPIISLENYKECNCDIELYCNKIIEKASNISREKFKKSSFKDQIAYIINKRYSDLCSTTLYFNYPKTINQLQINFNVNLDELEYLFNIKNKIIEAIKKFEFTSMKNLQRSISSEKERKKNYSKIKKKLFSWNSFWSDKEPFYENSQKRLKQKLVMHYTKEFSTPFITPIIDIEKHLPSFKEFSKSKLFIDNQLNLPYRIVLKPDEIFKEHYVSEIKIKNNYLSCIYKFCYNCGIWPIYNTVQFRESTGNKKNPKHEFKCCLLKKGKHIPVNLVYKNDYITYDFRELSNLDKEGVSFCLKKDTCHGSIFCLDNLEKNFCPNNIFIERINYIFFRKYFFSSNSLEIFTKDNKSYYFIFMTEEDRNQIIQLISGNWSTLFKEVKINKNPVVLINQELQSNQTNLYFSSFPEIVSKWENCQISSFEFIMLCNLLSNRSFYDLAQYPVFPWTLNNYSKSKIKYPDDLRDFKTPMGMMDFNSESSSRKQKYIDYYNDMNKEYKSDKSSNTFHNNFSLLNKIPFCFGSHYSNSIYVCHFLTRILPYGTIGIELQGDKFDNPNRMFKSVERAFHCATTQRMDVRELVPEFYYLSEMFYNLNNLNMGLKESSNVKMPKFAKNQVYNFTRKLRRSLESSHSEINEWIDIIFGLRQSGKKAEEIHNIFMAYSYDGIIKKEWLNDKNEIENIIIYGEFGITPIQITTKEIPKRLKNRVRQIDNFKDTIFIEKKLKYFSSNSYSPVSFLKKQESLKILMSNFTEISLSFKLQKEKVTVKEEINKNILNFKPLNLQITFFLIKNFLKTNLNGLSLFRCNDSLIINAGFIDNRIVTIDNTKDIKCNLLKIKFEEYPITAIAEIKAENLFIVGNSRGGVIVYQLEEKLNFVKLISLYDHYQGIITITVHDKLNIFCTASYDNYLMIYTIPRFQLIRSIYLGKSFTPDFVFLSDSPLPCVVAYSSEKNKLMSFTINGRKIEITNRKNDTGNQYDSVDKGNVTAHTIFKNQEFLDYLILGYSKGYIEVRKFPTMKIVYEKFVFEKEKVILIQELLGGKMLCVLGENNNCKFIKDLNITSSTSEINGGTEQ